jgi:GH24 family phage-related lysozyme (muramidase)
MDKLSKWKEENKDLIEEMWKSSHAMGLAMICNACGGGSISTCACAKQRFFETMTPEILAKLIRRKEKEEKWCLEYLEKRKGALAPL